MLVNITNADPKSDAYKKKESEICAALGVKDRMSNPQWPLPNAKPSTESRFWGWRSTWTFPAEIWAGSIRVGDDWATLLIYYVGHSEFIDGGFAVLTFDRSKAQRVEYFEWRACEHEFVESRIGNCWHRYTCKKCGKTYDIDSSG